MAGTSPVTGTTPDYVALDKGERVSFSGKEKENEKQRVDIGNKTTLIAMYATTKDGKCKYKPVNAGFWEEMNQSGSSCVPTLMFYGSGKRVAK
ncbi:MAG: hypothetical protein ACPGUD_12070 [Parashewanella sp.]